MPRLQDCFPDHNHKIAKSIEFFYAMRYAPCPMRFMNYKKEGEKDGKEDFDR